jgi:endonuclease/exonuclease/phosphatase family metal-dependent hydrolase
MERLDAIDPALPTIVCGDFNATPSSPCHAVFTSQQRDENMAPGRSFTNVLPPGSPGTHHGFTGKDDGRYIDWILYRGGFELFASGILREKYAGGYPSDHFPVFAEFALL